jgi:hypothetical protein
VRSTDRQTRRRPDRRGGGPRPDKPVRQTRPTNPSDESGLAGPFFCAFPSPKRRGRVHPGPRAACPSSLVRCTIRR